MIRGIDVNFKEGKAFVADYDEGTIYYYNFMTPCAADSPLELINSFKGPTNPRVLKYWSQRNELYVGCEGGRIAIYELDNLDGGSICKKISFSNLIIRRN